MKKIKYLSLLVICCSCSTQSNQDTRKATDIVTQNKAVVQNSINAFNNHDWTAYASFYSDPAIFLDPSLGKDYVSQSREDIVEKYSDLQSYFPNIRDSIHNIIGEGDIVAIEFVSRGISINGDTLYLPLCAVFKVKDGLIIKDATYFDN